MGRASLPGLWTELDASVLAMAVDLEVVEADLAAGRLGCAGCDRPLARWGFAREREVRTLDGVRSLRPRRARCHACERTHVLLPAWSVPRRRDGAEVMARRCWPRRREPGTAESRRGSGAHRARCVAGCARSRAAPRRSQAAPGAGRTRSMPPRSATADRPDRGSPMLSRRSGRCTGHTAWASVRPSIRGSSRSCSRACCTDRHATRPASRSPLLPRAHGRSHTRSSLDLGSASRRTAGAVTERSEGKGSEATLTAPPPAPPSSKSRGGAAPRDADSAVRLLWRGDGRARFFAICASPRTLWSFGRSSPAPLFRFFARHLHHHLPWRRHHHFRCPLTTTACSGRACPRRGTQRPQPTCTPRRPAARTSR